MKSLFIIGFLLIGTSLSAQPWLDYLNGENVKLKDVEQVYRAKLKGNAINNEPHDSFEGQDYHFERWLFHWEGRTDKDGYLTTPRKHWEAYKQQQANVRAQAKGTSPDVSWTFHGPDNALEANFGLGRINVMAFHPTDTNTYLVGTPGGGIWHTTDDGSNWNVLDDFLPKLGVSDIKYNPLNPNTIYICSGDRDANDTYSMGVFKSIDGGTTWDTTGFQYGFTDNKQTTGIYVNPIDTNSLTLTTTAGIYKSFNAGKTWSEVYAGSYQQLLAHPTDTNILYASGVYSGSPQVHRSSDGGNTWYKITNIVGARRIEMATTKANPAIVKIIVAKNDYGLLGIYSSNDTGKTFTEIFNPDGCKKNILASTAKGNQCGGQGWYDLTIQISPVNPNNVVVGGVNTWYSTDGGSSWDVANQWSNAVPGVTRVHADKHHHQFHPLRTNILYECNDGGIYKTAAPMSGNSIWNNLSDGLGITQFYRNAVSNTASYVLGGAQDNGTKMLTGGTSKQMTGGDGMDCHIDPIDSTIIYTSIQYGELRISTDGGDNFTDIQNNIPGKPKGAWITPFAIYQQSPNLIFAGYKEVYFSADRGGSWTSTSPNFGSDLDRISLSNADANYIYVMSSNAASHFIRYSSDLGGNWGVLDVPSNTVASDILADPRHANIVWATYRNYSGNKVAMRNINSGDWVAYNNGLPDVPVNCIAFDHINQTFYIGTDLGVYYREYTKNDWQYFNNGTLPNVEVIDLGINTTTNTIWAATYGRGMWSSPTHKSTTGIANTVPLAHNVVSLSPNPNKGTFSIATDNPKINGQLLQVRIVNITGTTVWDGQVTMRNAGTEIKADLPRGTYIVEVVKQQTVFAKTKMVVF